MMVFVVFYGLIALVSSALYAGLDHARDCTEYGQRCARWGIAYDPNRHAKTIEELRAMVNDRDAMLWTERTRNAEERRALVEDAYHAGWADRSEGASYEHRLRALLAEDQT